MRDVVEINDGVVFVRGRSRGAIYNLNDGNVYSINREACQALEGFIAGGVLAGDFLGRLERQALIDARYAPRPFPVPEKRKELEFVWLELTEQCNLRCSHCYVGDRHEDDPGARLSLDQWKDVLRQLKEAGCRRIEFIGGEPTVHPHFEELLGLAASMGHNVSIFSNLQAFNDRILRLAKENSVTVHFSIYGSTADVHDSITRKEGSFKTLMQWVDRLLECGLEVVASITVMRRNQDDIGGVIDLLKSRGIPRSRISIDTVRATAKRDVRDLAVADPEKSLVLRRKPNFRVTRSFFEKAFYANTCLYGKFSIHPDGLVCPCEFARDIVYGDVKSQSIGRILESDALNRFWYLDFSRIEPCAGCEYRFACKDCRMLQEEQGACRKNPRCLYDPLAGSWGDA